MRYYSPMFVHALLLANVDFHTKYDIHNFTHSKDIVGPQNVKIGHVTLTTSIYISGVICHLKVNN